MAPGGLFPVYRLPSVTDETDHVPTARASAENDCDTEDDSAQSPFTQVAHDQSAVDESDSDKLTITEKKGAGKRSKKRATSPTESVPTRKKAKKDGAAGVGTKAKKVTSMRLPMAYEKASPADKFLFDNHEKGMSFEEITPHWLELAGRSTSDVLSKSMLSNRYQRMKTNFSMIKEEDHVLLFEAKSRVDAILDAERWARVAADMVSNGGWSYKPDNLERCYKRLMEKGGDLTKATAPRDRNEADDDGDD